MSFNTKKTAYCAMAIALAVVASFIRLFRFPFGGSVTLCSMLLISLPGWFYGLRTGLLCGLIYGLVAFVQDPYFMTVPQVILDYGLSFMALGLSGLFRDKKNGLITGYLVSVCARWIVASIAGLIWISLGSTAWDGWAPLPYTLCYNGAYIGAEALITLLLLRIPALNKALSNIKKQALHTTVL